VGQPGKKCIKENNLNLSEKSRIQSGVYHEFKISHNAGYTFFDIFNLLSGTGKNKG
jgi:hypothetical protein